MSIVNALLSKLGLSNQAGPVPISPIAGLRDHLAVADYSNLNPEVMALASFLRDGSLKVNGVTEPLLYGWSLGGGDFGVTRISAKVLKIDNINFRLYNRDFIAGIYVTTKTGVITVLNLAAMTITETLVKGGAGGQNIASINYYTITSDDWSISDAADTQITVLIRAPMRQRYVSGIRMAKTGDTYWDGVNVTAVDGSDLLTFDPIDTRFWSSISFWLEAGTLGSTPDTNKNIVQMVATPLRSSSDTPVGLLPRFDLSSIAADVTANNVYLKSPASSDTVVKKLVGGWDLKISWYSIRLYLPNKTAASVFLPRTLKFEYQLEYRP